MTSTSPSLTAVAGPPAESTDLADFGYRQELQRDLGSYASFAAGFSFVSILTTVFQLFFLGYGFGGPAFFWTWPLVFVGQYLVALNFSELAARYPISGAIYQWSTRLSNPTAGWFAGWTMIVAQTVTVAAAAIALQVVLPGVWAGFQVIGTDTSPTSADGAANAVLLGSLLVVVTTAINVAGVRVMGVVNAVGVTLELVGIVVVVGLLLTHAERGPQVVLTTAGHGSGGYTGAFLVSALMAAYVLVGFDSAGELSEETRDARRVAPRTILVAVAVSGLAGALMILAALMAAPSLTDGNLDTQGLPWVLTSIATGTTGRVLLAMVAVAVFVCTLSIQTAGARMVYSMARDGVLPGARLLAHVPARTGTPAAAAVLIGLGTVAVLLVNVSQGAIFLALTSVCIVLLYLAYLFVTVPLLLRRLAGWPRGLHEPRTDTGRHLFRLGRAGMPLNALAVVFQVAMAVNLVWPRAEVYNAGGGPAYLTWFGPLFVAGTLAVGAVVHLTVRRRVGTASAATTTATR